MTNEDKNMMYFKSVYTGQCYCINFIPKYDGYELITKAEYEEWMKRNGLA